MTPSEAHQVDVLIVGAGPTALTAALELAEYDVSCAILSATSGPPDELGEVALHPDSVLILDRLTSGAISAEGHAWTTTRTQIGRFDFGPDETPGRTTAEIGTVVDLDPARLVGVLRDQVEAAPSTRFVLGQRIVRLTHADTDNDGRVTVATKDETGERNSWSARYVVAADGPESATRDLLGLPFDGPPRATAVLVSNVVADLPVADERLIVLDPPGGTWALEVLPLPDGRSRFTWIVPPTEDLSATDAADMVDDQLRELLGAGVAYRATESGLVLSRQRVAPRFAVGNVFLVGRAAHTAAVPLAARSLNAGIADAENLAWKLAFAVHGNAGSALLESYDEERRGAADADLADLEAAQETLAPRDRWARLRRRTVLATRTRRLDVGRLPHPTVYRSSPVLQPGCGGPGPHLPVRDLSGWSGTLQSLRGGSMVVVAIGPTVEEATELATPVAAALPATGPPPVRVVAGAAADATEGLDLAGAAMGNFLVIRPDGRLAWKVNGENDPSEVARTLASVLLHATGQ